MRNVFLDELRYARRLAARVLPPSRGKTPDGSSGPNSRRSSLADALASRRPSLGQMTGRRPSRGEYSEVWTRPRSRGDGDASPSRPGSRGAWPFGGLFARPGSRGSRPGSRGESVGEAVGLSSSRPESVGLASRPGSKGESVVGARPTTGGSVRFEEYPERPWTGQSRVSFADDLERPPTTGQVSFADGWASPARPETAQSLTGFDDDDRPRTGGSVRFADDCASDVSSIEEID